MDGGREEASGVGIERGREGARKGNFKGGILRRALPLDSIQYIHKPSHNAALAIDSIQYIHKPSHNPALAIDTLLSQMKNSEQV